MSSPVGVASATCRAFAPFAPSSCRIRLSVLPYSPSPKFVCRMWPVLSIRYSAGQYWFAYASHVLKRLSWTTGYVIPSRFTAARTFDETCSNANSGVCTPMITKPSLWYVAYHAFRCGSVRRQLMHEYVQKSISTTLPRSCESTSGLVLIQSPSGFSGGAIP